MFQQWNFHEKTFIYSLFSPLLLYCLQIRRIAGSLRRSAHACMKINESKKTEYKTTTTTFFYYLYSILITLLDSDMRVRTAQKKEARLCVVVVLKIKRENEERKKTWRFRSLSCVFILIKIQLSNISSREAGNISSSLFLSIWPSFILIFSPLPTPGPYPFSFLKSIYHTHLISSQLLIHVCHTSLFSVFFHVVSHFNNVTCYKEQTLFYVCHV